MKIYHFSFAIQIKGGGEEGEKDIWVINLFWHLVALGGVGISHLSIIMVCGVTRVLSPPQGKQVSLRETSDKAQLGEKSYK